MEDRLENDICDLDPNKICDNCCKCLEEPGELTDENGYRVIVAEFSTEDAEENALEREQESAIAALFQGDGGDEDEFDELDPLNIPPELMAEWEAKLAASFREDEENKPQIKLKGSRKKRD